VREIVNRASCGLILSALEGANYASSEYLLCGVPVVTTKSLGGRDEFFDSRHVIYVEATPDAVEAGVAEMNSRQIDRTEVRTSVLAKSLEHRRRLIGLLSRIAGRDVMPEVDERLWHPGFTDKLRTWTLV